MDVVVLEAPFAIETPGGEQTVSDACSLALASGRCAFGEPVAPDAAVAHVTIRMQADDARVTVKAPGGEVTRNLHFAASDAPAERLRSAGLVAGTLAEGLRAPPATPPPKPKPPPPKPPRPVAPPVKPPPSFWIDVGATAGPALDDGSWKGGPTLRASYAIAGLPLSGLVSLRYTYRGPDEADLGVHWVSGSVGIGGQLLLLDERLWLHARVELVGELISAVASDPFSGDTDEASRWLGGGRLGLDAAWMFQRNVGVFAGFDVTWLQSATLVQVRKDSSGRAPPYEIGPSLGMRIAVP